MFTGLVESLAEVAGIVPEPPGVRLLIREARIAAESSIGDSIALNGCCLTVVAIDGDTLAFQAGEETLSRTNLGELKAAGVVNVERSLKMGDAIGGHLVSGHIDAVGTVDSRSDDADWCTMWFRVPPSLTRQMASKGSIAVDGVSLTLVDVEADRFSVALIPHTLSVTTLGCRKLGDRVNLETDVVAKYVEKGVLAYLPQMPSSTQDLERTFEFEGHLFPHRFESRRHFDETIGFLQKDKSFYAVPVEHPKTNLGFVERWFRGRSSGTILRIIEPDAPYRGECELVQELRGSQLG